MPKKKGLVTFHSMEDKFRIQDENRQVATMARRLSLSFQPCAPHSRPAGWTRRMWLPGADTTFA